MNRCFIRWLLFVIFSINICAANESKADFFSNPQIITANEILEQLDSKSLDMCWQFGKNDFFHFITKKNEVYFEILFDRIPDSYDEWAKNLFIEESLDNTGTKSFIFSYDHKNNGQLIINQPRKQEKDRGPNNSTYLVDERRIVEHSSPQTIVEDDLISVICNKSIVFYTGAGLSVASGVPSMNQLNDLLGLEEGKPFIDFLREILEHPDQFVEKISIFHNACFYCPPTEAHNALKKLALFKNTKIVTENLDCLHEYSGILPYRIDAKQLREELGSSQLHQIDYIICVGLSYDDRGFLGWYKRHNPKGKIIAINLGNPSYLGDEDLIIREDLQCLIPSLENKILRGRVTAVDDPVGTCDIF
jgi:NAD-dependent SIR2 family protein deacetylase